MTWELKYQGYISSTTWAAKRQERLEHDGHKCQGCGISQQQLNELLNEIYFMRKMIYANKLNLDFFSTPFDSESVEFLESIKMDLYKIASFDIGNMTLLEKVAKTNKPVIMSVGMSNIDEITRAYNCIKKYNKKIQ